MDQIETFKTLIAPLLSAFIVLIAQFFLQPSIQKRIKAQEELWLHKKQIYIKTIELIDNKFDSMNYGDSKPIKEEPETEKINNIFRELLMVCDNQEIITNFQNFMDNSIKDYCSPANRGSYIKLLRSDLGGKSKLSIADEKIPYFRIHSKK